MDLQNTLPHMRGQSVLVGGTTYQLDPDGIVRGVKDDDAKKLLHRQKSAWRICPERTPVRRTEDVTVPNHDVSAVIAAQDQFEAQKRGEANPPPSSVNEAGKDKPPVPDESMAIEDLRQIADAYQVSYNARTSKEALVKKLKEVMGQE